MQLLDHVVRTMNNQILEAKEQYDEGLTSAKEYMNLVAQIAITALDASATLKDTYEE